MTLPDDRRASAGPSWFEQNPKKTLLAVLAAFLAAVEILLRLLAVGGVFPYQRYPTEFRPTFWDDIDPVVGVWRYPQAVFRHTSPCFDVTYHTNRYGARDAERRLHSGARRRVVVLGDSFIEGFGVAAQQRLTDLLEARTGIEHLNFGSGGGFGSIQQWLLYENLAARFDHSDVFIFMLPCNDFADNDPAHYPPDRYRPYLKKRKGDFEVYYPVDFADRRIEFRSPAETVKNWVDNHVYLANFLRWFVREVKIRLGLKQAPPTAGQTAFYDRYSDRDLEILLYTYRRIAQKAGPRQVYLFTIPVEQDFNAAMEQGTDLRIVRDLTAFARGLPNLHYADLLDDFIAHARKTGASYRDYTLGCDPHWGPLGHRVAAEAVWRAVWAASDAAAAPP